MAAHNVLMIVTDWAGFNLWASLLLSFSIVTSGGYFAHSILTFGQPMSVHGMARYIAGIGTGSAIAVPIIWFWKIGLSLPMIIASPMASVCTVGINFVLVRWAIVRSV
jgi:putative flippase GtrA